MAKTDLEIETHDEIRLGYLQANICNIRNKNITINIRNLYRSPAQQTEAVSILETAKFFGKLPG